MTGISSSAAERFGDRKAKNWPPLMRGLSAKLTGGEITYLANFCRFCGRGSLPQASANADASSLVRGSRKARIPAFLIRGSQKARIPAFLIRGSQKVRTPAFLIRRRQKARIPAFLVRGSQKARIHVFLIRGRQKSKNSSLSHQRKAGVDMIGVLLEKTADLHYFRFAYRDNSFI